MKFLYSTLLALFLLMIGVCHAAYFLSISDVHFDPFATCETQNTNDVCPIVTALMAAEVNQWPAVFEQYSSKKLAGYGTDTNYALLLSSLAEMRMLNDHYHPQFMLLIGDYLAHNFQQKYMLYSGNTSQQGYQSFVKKTMQFLTDEFHATLPTLPIYPVIGNNDSYRGDYISDPNGAFYRDTADAWLVFFANPINRLKFLQNFRYAGYYAVMPTSNSQARVLILNSVLFSMHAKGENIADAAEAQLSWLHQQLSQAQSLRQSVWLVFHIPVGIDAYNTSMTGTTTSFWQMPYTQTFLSLVNQYSSTITGIFTSHLHMDGFELLNSSAGATLDSFTPSIAPSSGNNPGIKVFQYNHLSFVLNDFITYYLPLDNASTDTNKQSWQQLYDFNAIFQPQCQQCLLINGMHQLQKNNSLVSRFVQYFAVGTSTEPISKPVNWPYYWCSISHFTVSDFQKCVDEFNQAKRR